MNVDSAGELLYLINAVVQACLFLESKQVYHGNLTPDNIFVSPEGIIKVADNGMVQDQMTAYQQALTSGTLQNGFLSPQLLAELRQRNLAPEYNPFRSDVFSLGVTSLLAATLNLKSGVYNNAEYTVNWDVVNTLLIQARSLYSQNIINLIQSMLQREEAQRPSWAQLYESLVPYRNGGNVIIQPVQSSPVLVSSPLRSSQQVVVLNF